MEEEKTLVIPLGGSTADGEQVNPTTGPVESAGANAVLPEQRRGKAVVKPTAVNKPQVRGGGVPTPEKPKKAGVVGKIFAALGALILFLLIVCIIGAGILYFLATRDEMPTAPEVKSEMSDVIVDSALEMISDKQISFNSDEVNLFLKTLVEKSAEKTAEHGIEVDDLFSVVANDKITLYCRLRYKGFSLPIRAVAKLSYDDPYIVISLESAYIGKVSLPSDILVKYFGENVVSDNISIYNGMIYYDTSEFNDKITEVTIKQLGLEVDKTNQEEKSWWQSVKDWFKEKTAGIVSDMIHNVKFKNVTIIDNNIVISLSYEKTEND